MAVKSKLWAWGLGLFIHASSMACGYVKSVDIQFNRGAPELSSSELSKLNSWLDTSLAVFPIVNIMIVESHAYAPNKKMAKTLASRRGEFIKSVLLKKLPADTQFDITSFGHTESKVDTLPSTDIAFLDLRPNEEKMRLPPCTPVPLSRSSGAPQ